MTEKHSRIFTHGPERPDALVLMLHGVGSDGADLIGLAPAWAGAAPGAVFVSPDAPEAYDMAPFGRQWFSLRDRAPQVLLQEVRRAFPALQAFIEGQLQIYGLPYNRLILMGFSQGAMMALYAAPRLPECPGGVMAFSSALLWEDEGAVHRPPILLAHGEADDVVPVSAFRYAKQALAARGFPLVAHATPGLAHGIDRAGTEAGAAFLARALGT